MKKRTFIKKLSQGSLALAGTPWFLGSCSPSPKDKQALELPTEISKDTAPNFPLKNWSWARPHDDWSLDDWKRRLASAKASGIDAILLEVYNSHQAYFDTDRLPVKADLLGQLLPICHELGLEFHAWMWTMPCNIESIVKNHPDWYAVNGLGESAATKPAYVDYYKFLCPRHPEAQEFIRQNVASLASISEIDGVHFDYVRLPDVILAEGLQPKYNIVQDKEYPQYDYCYSKIFRDQFKAQTGIDPLTDLKDPANNEAWRQFRYDSITELVNGKLLPEAKKHNKYVTAAVFPNWESVRQEWHKWDLDAFLPMLYNNFYNRDITFIKEHTSLAKKRTNNQKPIYAGVFVPELSPEQLQQAYKTAITAGANGISTFALSSLDDNHIKSLTQAIKA